MEIRTGVVILIAVLSLMVGYAIGYSIGVIKMFTMLRQNMKSVVQTVILEMKIQEEFEKKTQNDIVS